MPQTYIVDKEYHNSRFDRWFKNNIKKLPQSLIEKLIRQNKVKINKKKVRSSYRLQSGDKVEVYDISKFKELIRSKTIRYRPAKKEINVYNNYIIEDNENFIVINKPSGIPVQSGTKSFRNIIDILKDSKIFEKNKPYIVHRLDKDTSGVLIIAKTREYAQLFTSLFRIRKIHKTYLAIVHGNVSKSKKILVDNLITFEKNKKLIQKAITHVKVIKNSDSYSFLELNPITGRKHQLRKQLYNIGNPIIGDEKYFLYKNTKVKYKKKILMLHAYKIKFMINNVQYNFKADYNESFAEFLKSKI